MKHEPKADATCLQKFVKDLENVNLSQLGVDANLKRITRNLVQENPQTFSFVIAGPSRLNERKVERIYSKGEIKRLVCEHLIHEYQNEPIINAVTEYLYGVHIGK